MRKDKNILLIILRFGLGLRVGLHNILGSDEKAIGKLGLKFGLGIRLGRGLIFGLVDNQRSSGDGRVGICLLGLGSSFLGLGGKAFDQGDEALRDGIDIGGGVSATVVCPLDDPRRAGECTCDQNVVGTGEAQLEGPVIALDSTRLTSGNGTREICARKQLHGHMLEQMRELGIVHNVAERLAAIAVAGMVGELGDKVGNEVGACRIVAGEKRRIVVNMDFCGERTRAYGYFPDIN